MKQAPKIIAVSEKLYRRFLCLYPRLHRRDFGGPMAQLFRDQCRDAWAAGRSAGLLKLWLRTLPDLIKTSTKEQLAAIERNSVMKHFKDSATILLVTGLVLAFLTFSPEIRPYHPVFMLLLVAASLAITAKACVEAFRPGSEWGRIMFRTLVLMFFYALFMPAWAKLKIQQGLPPGVHDPVGFMVCISLFLNPVVAFLKFAQFLVQRRKS
jgi:hypothetical protein